MEIEMADYYPDFGGKAVKLTINHELEGEGAKALIRHATGLDLPIEILSNDEWVAHRLIADRYRDRRVFLAGDACHLHPPFGGYGIFDILSPSFFRSFLSKSALQRLERSYTFATSKHICVLPLLFWR